AAIRCRNGVGSQHDCELAAARYFLQERQPLAPPLEMIRREQDTRARVLQPGRDRAGAESRENWNYRRPQLETAVDDREQLRHHGHTKRQPVAFPDTARLQPVSDPVRLSLQFRERQGAPGSILGFPETRDAIGAGPAIETIVRDVQTPAQEPLRPFRASADVHHLAIGREPLDAHLPHHLGPESLGLFAGKAQKLFAVLEPQPPHELPNVSVFDEFFGWLPDHCGNLLSISLGGLGYASVPAGSLDFLTCDLCAMCGW